MDYVLDEETIPRYPKISRTAETGTSVRTLRRPFHSSQSSLVAICWKNDIRLIGVQNPSRRYKKLCHPKTPRPERKITALKILSRVLSLILKVWLGRTQYPFRSNATLLFPDVVAIRENCEGDRFRRGLFDSNPEFLERDALCPCLVCEVLKKRNAR